MQTIYSHFIDNLIKKENLINVGRFGKASQSSLSTWSKENDAQRAVSGNYFKDYAFHTEKELNPWWQIEFKTPVAVEYIVINNRKTSPFDEIASTLNIVAYDDKNNEELLHSGTLYFGSEEQGCPLIIPLKGKVLLKRLRTTLLKKDYLHLSNIDFLLADPLSVFNNKMVFIARRGDGLGERLRALLNSMVMANITGGCFIFSWPTTFSENEYHAIDMPENIFCTDFIDNYLFDEAVFNKSELEPLKNINNIRRDLNVGYRKLGITLDQGFLKSQVRDKTLNIENISSEYRIAFEKIRFNKSVTDAKNLAKIVKLKNKVLGIHLRTGDIVYSEIRNMDRWGNKVVPFYVIDILVTRYLELGYDIVLFTLDNKACKYFKDKYGVILSNDLIPDSYDDIQRAIFDMVLMSRCNEIVGGRSGFAIVASWIGNCKILDYNDILTKKEVRSSFVSSYSIEGVLSSRLTNPLLRSFSIAHYLQNFKEVTFLSERIELLKECIKIDHTNNFYRLLLAIDYYKENNYELADSILLEVVNSTDTTNLIWLAQKKFRGSTVLSEYTSELENYASQGSIVAAYIAFLSRYYDDGIDMNNSFYQEIVKKSPKNSIDKELLQEIQKKLTV